MLGSKMGWGGMGVRSWVSSVMKENHSTITIIDSTKNTRSQAPLPASSILLKRHRQCLYPFLTSLLSSPSIFRYNVPPFSFLHSFLLHLPIHPPFIATHSAYTTYLLIRHCVPVSNLRDVGLIAFSCIGDLDR